MIRDLNRDEGRQKGQSYHKIHQLLLIGKEADTQYQDDGPPITRSKTIPFDKTQCIFYSPITPLDTSPTKGPHLYRCCTSNQGERIQETLEKSDKCVGKR